MSPREIEKKQIADLLRASFPTDDLEKKDPSSFHTLVTVLSFHPNAKAKLLDLRKLRVRKSGRGDAYGIILEYLDGSIDDISWTKAIDCKYGSAKNWENKKLMAAHRKAVSNQISKSSLDNPCSSCTLCGKNIHKGVAHVDHIVLFSDLVKQFISISPFPIPTKVVSDIALKGHKFTAIDSEYESAFADFHLAHAQLRWTCEHCNLSRKKSMSSPVASTAVATRILSK